MPLTSISASKSSAVFGVLFSGFGPRFLAGFLTILLIDRSSNQLPITGFIEIEELNPQKSNNEQFQNMRLT